ncbi:AraC family transcriptional regulator [Streptomyces diacarni]|uniref:AraC family transcriptional regulator n=1 Tax=Streptomyces diacarni TaxID=2800381 RepID=A0A367F203_9ACTN|nr:AraC family transcriptional regulator [Streptomyces diacarni]RCG24386.1 AraC family transcriptional regulator [Streptomyces diacarni]
MAEALAEVLSGARATGGLLHRAVLAPPWGVRVQDGAPLAVASLVRGEGWVLPTAAADPWPGGPGPGPEPGDRPGPIPLAPGDVAVLRGPDPYVLADDPATPPDLLIQPGDCCTSVDGVDLCEEIALGVRTYGRDPDAPTVLLSGGYQLHGDLSSRLLDALPPVLVLRGTEWDAGLMALVEQEIVRDAPGQQLVLDRVLDLLLVSVLRAWFARPEADAPAWYRAQSDPVVGVALRLLHEQPGHGWTVASLAAKSGVSRASLARRFTELLGEPPMAYLAQRRIDLAARLLREPGATLAAVARRVGYADGFALSAAFKRVRGVSPAEYRAGQPVRG